MDKQLQLFSATLEPWLLVQRGWLKLEAVFAAPDIQRQVPGEAAARKLLSLEHDEKSGGVIIRISTPD